MALDIKGETSQGELGTLLALDSTTLTRMLKPLMKSGWIAERPGADRRQRLLRLTSGGRVKLKQSLSHWERAQRNLQHRLGEPTWSQMGKLLTHVAEASLGA